MAVVVGANDVVKLPPLKQRQALHLRHAHLRGERGQASCGVQLGPTPGYRWSVPPMLSYDLPHCLFVEGDAGESLRNIIAALEKLA